MRWTVIVIASLMPLSVSAEERLPSPAEVDAATGRAIEFLVKDALAWKQDHQCASCHHASLVVWAMREAKRIGRKVDEPVLADLSRWQAEAGNGKFNLDRPASAPNAASPKAIYFALAVGTDPEPNEAAQAGLKLLLGTVKSEQSADGSWVAWPNTRPPIFGNSHESLTILAALALLPAIADDAEAKAALDKAIHWLTTTMSDDETQSIALRIVLWTRLRRSPEEIEPLVRRLKDRQNGDGGWSQAKELMSDAWATGQSLYAITTAGISADDQAVRRGQGFLVRTQRDDGSWPMISRPTEPGGQGAENLVPITGAGAAWGVLGLVRSHPNFSPMR